MKYIFFLLFIIALSSCGQHSDGEVYESGGGVTYSTVIRSGDLIFYCNETYNYGMGNVTITVLNNSRDYMYNFDIETQLFQDGVIVESSGVGYIYDLYPGQSQQANGFSTRYTINDQLIRVVITRVVKIKINNVS